MLLDNFFNSKGQFERSQRFKKKKKEKAKISSHKSQKPTKCDPEKVNSSCRTFNVSGYHRYWILIH